ncbi:MAG: hypothetical protein WBL63_25465, partial [Candidatus Acidiferrum sp.]
GNVRKPPEIVVQKCLPACVAEELLLYDSENGVTRKSRRVTKLRKYDWPSGQGAAHRLVWRSAAACYPL